MVSHMRSLKALADEVNVVNYGSFIFSLSFGPDSCDAYVHRAQVEGNKMCFHMHYMKSDRLLEADDVGNNILDWGVGARKFYPERRSASIKAARVAKEA